MKIKSKVTKFTGERKIVEIPKAARDNFKLGEEVNIEKILIRTINGIKEV